MYLYANGCSMTYGSELSDDEVTKVCQDHEYRWANSWPGRLRELLDAVGVYNDAVPSGSNDRIVRTTTGFVSRWLGAGLPAEALFVVIGWSHCSRREFYVGGDYHQVVPRHGYDLPGLNRVVRAYRRFADHDTEAQWRYAVQVVTLRALLRDNGVPYLFFNAVDAPCLPAEFAVPPLAAAFTDQRFWGRCGAGATMVRQLRQRENTWYDQHPNEAGHRIWAELIAGAIVPLAPVAMSADLVAKSDFPIVGGTRVTRRHDRKRGDSLGPGSRLGRAVARLRAPERSEPSGSDPFIYP